MSPKALLRPFIMLSTRPLPILDRIAGSDEKTETICPGSWRNKLTMPPIKFGRVPSTKFRVLLNTDSTMEGILAIASAIILGRDMKNDPTLLTIAGTVMVKKFRTLLKMLDTIPGIDCNICPILCGKDAKKERVAVVTS